MILSLMVGDREETERGYLTLGGIIAKSLNNWWFMIHRAAAQGCFGDRGRSTG